MRIAVLASVGRRLDAYGGLIVAGLLLLGGTAKAVPVAPEPPALTNLSQVRQLAAQRQQLIHTIRLEGDVWQIDPSNGVLVLHDDSGVEFLSWTYRDIPSNPTSGCVGSERLRCKRQRLRAGLCAAIGGGERWLSCKREESGSVFLKSGFQPIQLRWFNSTGPFGLKVEIEGPGLSASRSPPPPSFTREGIPQPFPLISAMGLDYRCYEGRWEYLPDFDNMTPVRTGMATNFDLSMAVTR